MVADRSSILRDCGLAASITYIEYGLRHDVLAREADFDRFRKRREREPVDSYSERNAMRSTCSGGLEYPEIVERIPQWPIYCLYPFLAIVDAPFLEERICNSQYESCGRLINLRFLRL